MFLWHIRLAVGLANACENALKQLKIKYQKGGTYIVMEGPAIFQSCRIQFIQKLES